MKDTQRTEYDVIVIGGGATGAGTARDCALRGLRTILVERLDFTAGATGRNHGLLHSGARYAHTDPESAAECIKENIIIKRIARHCVEDTGGLFVTLPEDSLDYQREFVADCGKAGIHVDELSPEEAVHLEPAVNPNLIGAVRVPDGSIDPFRLTTANVLDARLHGADILTYHEVIGFLREGDRITGVRLRSHRDGTETELRDTMLADTGLMGSIATRMAPLVNGTLRLKPVKYLIDKCLGIDDRRTFPKYSSRTFESWYKGVAGEQEAFKKHVSYFHGCYVNYNYPQLATSSTCCFTLRDEYPHLLHLDNADVRDHIALSVLFIYRLIDTGKAKIAFRKDYERRIAYHMPCHMQKLGWTYFSTSLMKMIQGVEFMELDSNCCGIAGTTLKGSKGFGGGWIVITLAWGLAVMCGVFIAGPYTGAHLNPAVTLGLAMSEKFSWSLVIPYMISQIIGAFLGGLTVYYFYKDHFDITDDKDTKLGVFATIPAIKNLKRNFLSEVIGTFVLILVILFLAERGNTSEVGLGSIGALPVAFLVVVIGMALGGTTGYAINPARDLGPRLAHQVLHIKGKGSSRWEYAWVPILGPILGAGFAVLVFWCYRMMCA